MWDYVLGIFVICFPIVLDIIVEGYCYYKNKKPKDDYKKDYRQIDMIIKNCKRNNLPKPMIYGDKKIMDYVNKKWKKINKEEN